ncbi:hypothetical protein BX666DRAFT_1917227 [Dichotomocladium elegans]|nr:hypothetical protein BX666DRAFT_1917227 [Dichotomocladium elegans]
MTSTLTSPSEPPAVQQQQQQQEQPPSSPPHKTEPSSPVLPITSPSLQPSLSSSPSGRHAVSPLERTASLLANHTGDEEDSKTQQLKAELRRQRRALESLEIERQQYRNDCRALTDRIDQAKDRLQQRQQSRQQLQKNYEDHLRSLRATDDDLNTIAQKIRHLRETISGLADALLEHVDQQQATLVLRDSWLNLRESIKRLGMPLMPNQIRMLTEKYMMDYLILNTMPSRFPALRPHQEYGKLEAWLRNHDRYTAVRLRQEIARIIVSGKHKDLRHMLEEESKQISYNLYRHLCDAYPYMEQYDKREKNPSKHFYARVQGLVDDSINLGFAMKGQEVDIAPRLVQEGKQSFDGAIMEEEQGLKEGIIEFCICPPFVTYTSLPFTLLEKGRVYCSLPRQAAQQLPQPQRA